jgi:hypothetical protein
MPVSVLPHLPSLPSAGMAALLYVTAGLAYIAVAGSALPDRLHPDASGDSLARAVGVGLTLALALLLWPAGPLLRAARATPVKRIPMVLGFRARAAGLRACARASSSGQVRPVAAEPAAAVRGDVADFAGQLDFAGAAARLRVACEQQRLVDAVFMASALVDDVSRRRGPDHPQVLDALEFLAHVAHLVGDEARSVRLYVHVADRRAWHFGVEYPGVKSALRNAYAAWLAVPDRSALRTGFLLLPSLRMVAGSDAPITRACEDRLRSLRAELGLGWSAVR